MNDKKYSLRPYLLAYKWHYAIGIFVLLAVDLANLVHSAVYWGDNRRNHCRKA